MQANFLNQNIEAIDNIIDDVLEGLDYNEDPPVDDWVSENVYLTRRFADTPGFMSTDITPYTKEPLNTLSDVATREVTLCWASQVSKSMTLTAMLAYAICHWEGQAIYTLPTSDAASWHVNNRWKPIGEASPSLVERGGFDRKNFKVAEQRFDKVTVSWLGSNSPNQGAMRSAPFLFLDEVDKMGESTEKEPGFFHLIKERCKSFPMHKIVKSSTPTLNNRGIWLEYIAGDQRKYLVPSPFEKDGDGFEFQFEGIKWDKDGDKDYCRDDSTPSGWDERRVREVAYYQCPFTGDKITDDTKPLMLKNGLWVPEVEQNINPSYQISSLYSPWLTFGDIAWKFLSTHKQPSGLHNFYNSWLGLPFIKKASVVTSQDVSEIQKNSPKYNRGQIPETNSGRPLCIFITVDVQQTHFYFVTRAWWADESSALLDYGQMFSYEDIKDYFKEKKFRWRDDEIPVHTGMIDAGYEAKKTAGVYNFCGEMIDEYQDQVFVPYLGRSTKQGFGAPITQRDVYFKDYALDQTVANDVIWKEELYQRRLKRKSHAEWYLPSRLDPSYRKQITDEKLVSQNGDLVWTHTGNNHLGDCEKMQLVLFARLAAALGR